MPAPVSAISAVDPIYNQLLGVANVSSPGKQPFAQILSDGIKAIENKLAKADQMVIAYASGEDVPLHRVTYALEEARLSFELMLQIRNRLVEASQQLLNMQV
jgi:flagellar hook-basal body complex protein FliE